MALQTAEIWKTVVNPCHVEYIIGIIRCSYMFIWFLKILSRGGQSISHSLSQCRDCWWHGEVSSGGIMMTSSNGNIFRVTGHLCGEFTGPRDAELWCFLWSASIYCGINSQVSGEVGRHKCVVLVIYRPELKISVFLVTVPSLVSEKPRAGAYFRIRMSPYQFSKFHGEHTLP